jgi:hypothetical protein
MNRVKPLFLEKEDRIFEWVAYAESGAPRPKGWAVGTVRDIPNINCGLDRSDLGKANKAFPNLKTRR